LVIDCPAELAQQSRKPFRDHGICQIGGGQILESFAS